MSESTPGGLRHSLEQAAATTVELVRTRLELVSLEFAEDRQRAMQRVVLLVVGALFCACALVAASGFVVLYFWETHRVAALGGVVVFYLAIGVGALLKLRASFREAPMPFAQTIAEFKRDGEWLSGEAQKRTDAGKDPK